VRQEIEDYRLERKIPYLLHFTRLDSLASIMTHGLCPRELIDKGQVAAAVNDDMRLDGRRGFNCLSVSFPNSLMFHRFQQNNVGVDWPILVIHPAVMAHKETLFCKHNAADARISSKANDDLKTLAAFNEMFEEIPNHTSRADQKLKNCDPTDVQAEVLIQGVIEPEYIFGIVFPGAASKNISLHLIGDKKAYINDRRGLYATRGYYRTWGPGA
jgi:ssDNA thymidine ADP-ribosyltransferase, DarT